MKTQYINMGFNKVATISSIQPYSRSNAVGVTLDCTLWTEYDRISFYFDRASFVYFELATPDWAEYGGYFGVQI